MSLAAVLPVAALTASILSHVISEKALLRGAAATAQFVQSVVVVEGEHIGIGGMGLAPLLDERSDTTDSSMSPGVIASARSNVRKHIERLPDALLTNVYAPDGLVVWSNNRRLIGTYAADQPEIRETFASRAVIGRYHYTNEPQRLEQRFPIQPKAFFLQSFFPILDDGGTPVLVVEVCREPPRFYRDMQNNKLLVWATTMTGGLVIYLALFGIIRRAAALLARQQRQLVETESLACIGEMATALAHGLRNPLASIRSSAELALDTQDLPVRKYAQDVIKQADFLSKWVRELLVFSRPFAFEAEPVDLCATLAAVLDSFAPALERAGIRVSWPRDDGQRQWVAGHATLVAQALHSVISNAVEAMPGGGEMRIVLRTLEGPRRVEVVVSDTGVGMSPQQLAAAFRPFHTSKAHGLGLGLPMIKRAMERFGGAVTLSSAENAGTQVRLIFRT